MWPQSSGSRALPLSNGLIPVTTSMLNRQDAASTLVLLCHLQFPHTCTFTIPHFRMMEPSQSGTLLPKLRKPMVADFYGNGKQGSAIAGNCRQLPFHWQLPAICPLRRALWEYSAWAWSWVRATSTDTPEHYMSISTSIRLVEFVCQEPRNLGSSPMHSGHMGSA